LVIRKGGERERGRLRKRRIGGGGRVV